LTVSTEWFERYTSLKMSSNRHRIKKYSCPCCRYRTLTERGGYEICQVCFWEDDGQDDHDADVVRGGPNYELSLADARSNFAKIGASCERVRGFDRRALPDEIELTTDH